MQGYAGRSTLVLLATLLLAGCTILTPIFGTRPDPAQRASDAIIAHTCQTFQPIRASRSDTEETLDQVAAHNRAWDALCKVDP